MTKSTVYLQIIKWSEAFIVPLKKYFQRFVSKVSNFKVNLVNQNFSIFLYCKLIWCNFRLTFLSRSVHCLFSLYGLVYQLRHCNYTPWNFLPMLYKIQAGLASYAFKRLSWFSRINTLILLHFLFVSNNSNPSSGFIFPRNPPVVFQIYL